MKLKISVRTFVIAASLSAVMAFSAHAYDVQGGTVVTASSVNFRKEASIESDVISSLPDGTRVAILDEVDTWYKVAYDGKTGFMSSEYVEAQDIMNIECGGAQVETDVLNVRSGPGTENSVVTKLSKGTVAKIIGINNAWFKIQYNGKTGYIAPEYVSVVPYSGGSGSSGKTTARSSSNGGTTAAASGSRQEIIDYAAGLLGCKYVYGGTSTKGFDCSGFTQYVFNAFGISLTHSSSAQYSNSSSISKSDLLPGDLVFFSNTKGGSTVGHVGIYVGDNQFIHAAAPGKGVRYDSMGDSYYSSHYVGSGRVISD